MQFASKPYLPVISPMLIHCDSIGEDCSKVSASNDGGTEEGVGGEEDIEDVSMLSFVFSPTTIDACIDSFSVFPSHNNVTTINKCTNKLVKYKRFMIK